MIKKLQITIDDVLKELSLKKGVLNLLFKLTYIILLSVPIIFYFLF